MTTKTILAERIAHEIFVNGSGEEADRLVLTSRAGRDLGGWCKGVIADKINEVLNAE